MSYTPQSPRRRWQTAQQISQFQRSHVLLILSNATAGKNTEFEDWATTYLRENIARSKRVLSLNLLEKHEIDITEGAYQEVPYQYLFIVELCLDGAKESRQLIEKINTWYSAESSAMPPASWLYYPASEKVGRLADRGQTMQTLAFANPLPGKESEFREWYATRHIRHALNVPQLVSGQYFESTNFQNTGASPIDYKMIAIYEQEGTPEEMIKSFAELPEDTLDFPSLDLINFAEWVYRPISILNPKRRTD